MKHVKLFEDFNTPTSLTEQQIYWLNSCTKNSKGWSLNPSTGLVDIMENFNCMLQNLEDFKGVKFGRVEGNFTCKQNELKILTGAPLSVGGNFDCSSNPLESLDGSPETVVGDFNCDWCKPLKNLKGAPLSVGGDFSCSSNNLESLDEAPETVGGNFDCRFNDLKNLEGAPKTVGKLFNCSHNIKLTSFAGAPESVGNFVGDEGLSGLLNWSKGWTKKGDAEFAKTLLAKLKEVDDWRHFQPKLKGMLLSLLDGKEISDCILSNNFSPSDKFEIYGIIKETLPDVWSKVKDQLDPDGATSDLMDLGF
jgi:hypothetical protein